MGEPLRDSLRDFAVRGCARCGGDHEHLQPKTFARPPKLSAGTIDAWVSCPSTGDPILIQVTKPEG